MESQRNFAVLCVAFLYAAAVSSIVLHTLCRSFRYIIELHSYVVALTSPFLLFVDYNAAAAVAASTAAFMYVVSVYDFNAVYDEVHGSKDGAFVAAAYNVHVIFLTLSLYAGCAMTYPAKKN